MSETRGIAALGRILAHIGGDKPTTAAALAAEDGLARSSVFEIVRKLERAGLATRQNGGILAPGPEAVRFGLAAHGAGTMQGAAEALLRHLRDETDGIAELGDGDTVLLRFAARWEGESDVVLETPLHAGPLRIRLTLRPNAGKAQRQHGREVLDRVRLSLQTQAGTR